jgi:peptidoglycan hydrolase-like protein with peptidoglycan-binding domain
LADRVAVEKLVKKIFSLLILVSVLLSACGSATADAQGTAMAIAVQLTLLAHPTNTEEAGPGPTETSTISEVAVAETETSPPLPAPTQPVPAQISEPTETPYVVPGWPLFRQGDTGPEVYAIQHLLRSHGYNLTVDGIFGPETRQQVMNFQLAKGLSTDGIVGPQTWTALIKGKTVMVGSQGQAVRAVQRLLRDRLGYNEVTVDGDFGPITDNVVVALQNAYDLTPDGIVGPQTWKALVAASPLAQ